MKIGQDFDRGRRSTYSMSRRDTPLPEPRSWLVLAAWVRLRGSDCEQVELNPEKTAKNERGYFLNISTNEDGW